MQGVFSEFAVFLLISVAAGALALRLRQPVLIAYIVIGIVAGPAVLGLVKAHDQIDLLAQVGVTVLLFVVGLKLDLQHMRHIGPSLLPPGLGQLAFTIHHRLRFHSPDGQGADGSVLRCGGADVLEHHHHRQTAFR